MILQVALRYWRLAPAFFPLTTLDQKLTSSPFKLFFVKQFSPQRWKDLQMVTIHISNFGQNQNPHVFFSCHDTRDVHTRYDAETCFVWKNIWKRRGCDLKCHQQKLFVWVWQGICLWWIEGRFWSLWVVSCWICLQTRSRRLSFLFFNTLWQTFCFLWWQQWPGQTSCSCAKVQLCFPTSHPPFKISRMCLTNLDELGWFP